MLRAFLVVISGVAFAAALAASWFGARGLWGATVVAGLVFAAALFERHRYKRLADQAPGEGWQRTNERFVDPETGQPVVVWFNPVSGERRYSTEAALHPAASREP